MKRAKQLLGILYCGICFVGWTQESSESERKDDHDKEKWYVYSDSEDRSWWKCYPSGSFDLTYNDWVGDLQSFRMQGPSLGININLMHSLSISRRGNVAVASGISYGHHRLRHDLPINYDQTTRATTVGLPNDFVIGSRSLISRQWSIPVELQFQTPRRNGFHLHVGGKLGYQSRLYEKGRDNGTKFKHKNKFISDKQPWVYSVHARAGFKQGPTLYASYNFNSVFRNSKSTHLNLIEMGISFTW